MEIANRDLHGLTELIVNASNIEVNVAKKMISCHAAFIWMLLGKRESSEIIECSRMLHIDGFLKQSHQRTQFSLDFIVMY